MSIFLKSFIYMFSESPNGSLTYPPMPDDQHHRVAPDTLGKITLTRHMLPPPVARSASLATTISVSPLWMLDDYRDPADSRASREVSVKVHQGKPAAHGRFSDVYSGWLQGELVAIKDLRIPVGEDARILKEFSREASIWQHLAHPHVLPFLGLCSDPVRPQVAMVSPWMAEGNIVEYLRRSPSTNRLQLISEIASGLAYLHSVPVVHGDLRGQNILIDSNSRPHIADFGLSRVVNEHLLLNMAEQSFRSLAPELLDDGELQVTPASDVYAFACTCYEIFTGDLPFSHISSEIDVLLAVHTHEHPPRPPVTHPATSRGLDDNIWAIMETCWDAFPDERPSASDICNSLATMSIFSPPPIIEGKRQIPAANTDICGVGFEGEDNLSHGTPLRGWNPTSRL